MELRGYKLETAMRLIISIVLGVLMGCYVEGAVNPEEQVLTKVGESRCQLVISRKLEYGWTPWSCSGFLTADERVLLGQPFKPHDFWKRPIDEQLIHLKDAILDLKILATAPRYHRALAYTDKMPSCFPGASTYPEMLEKQFETAVWKILQQDYIISFSEFSASLRKNLFINSDLYKAPLLMHFTNYLVPRYEFHYKNEQCLKDNIPYKTIKLPSMFEVAIVAKDEGVVVYEAK